MEFEKSSQDPKQVNLIPLINVIFLLLIFFMVAGTVEKLDIFEVNLPKSGQGKEKPVYPSIIYLAEDGKIAVNNDMVAKKDLKTIIKTIIIENPSREIIIKSDAGVAAKRLIWLMDIIEKSGGTDVSIVTRKH